MARRILFLVAAALLLAACGGGNKQKAVTPPPEKTTGECTSVPKPTPRPSPHLKAPTATLSTAKTYRVVVSTSCGAFTITLEQKTSPKADASFVSLARRGFFANTFFHRIVPGFIIQGGDPTGTGRGGPGYTTVDKPPITSQYTRGVVAMAKTATEPPGAAGSQFFIVTGANVQLPPEYTVLGTVTAGQDVVARIGKLGNPRTEQPTQTVVIQKMTVEVS